MILSVFIQTCFAFVASITFSLLFNAPKKELIFCGMSGALGWFFYTLLLYLWDSKVLATFVGAVVITAAARVLSYLRQNPSTLYLISGILPLVPGAGMFETMYGILNNDSGYAFTMGIETLKLAGVIAFGMILILSLPYGLFSPPWNRKK